MAAYAPGLQDWAACVRSRLRGEAGAQPRRRNHVAGTLRPKEESIKMLALHEESSQVLRRLLLQQMCPTW
ncbi:hypothetical protein GJ744_001208 [Endocarpon pusillum]|uniref:Uncharacterized protein n=1 Tax=Endocarpon pusillum TaxID=364733 RepID=A0A8H7ACG0_9EURO|nr:hypothetical protein GJ744_001208 [Endocarpon pusillum]